jgi:alanine racemase
MVMNPEPLSFETLIQWKLEPEIYSLRMLHSLINKLKQHELPEYPLHIKLDTGMHRLGFMEDEIPSLIKTLKENKTIKVASVFSHLAASEDPTMEQFTNEQGRRFDEMSKNISDALSYSFLRHLANTSAISRYPHLQYDMARLGIGLYGIDQSEQMEGKLQVVSTLKTTVSQVKNIKAGETVGYGRAGKADTAKKIATVSIGYADGYLRSLGLGKGYMLIHGKPASKIGKICMDMLMLDVTDIPDVKEGDTVIVFGKKPTLQKIAELAGTIPYEIMTSISPRVKRIYVQE